MGWLIKIEEKEGTAKYKVWSTVVDEFITDWMTRDEFIKYLFWKKFMDFMKDFTKEAMTFPDNWADKDEFKYLSGDEKQVAEYFDLLKSSGEAKTGQHVFPNKFKEVVISLGIEVEVKDTDKFHFKTHE
jgi:hypothetical protein